MTIQQPDHGKAASNPRARKVSESKLNNPIDKFNKALRKILSVPKKNLKDK
jgi:hypothetical protein